MLVCDSTMRGSYEKKDQSREIRTADVRSPENHIKSLEIHVISYEITKDFLSIIQVSHHFLGFSRISHYF